MLNQSAISCATEEVLSEFLSLSEPIRIDASEQAIFTVEDYTILVVREREKFGIFIADDAFSLSPITAGEWVCKCEEISDSCFFPKKTNKVKGSSGDRTIALQDNNGTK
ncbi:hypothetical protein DPMN_048332 [Dreissena polymorpha]|uniref:Uncharacterized protein n=1 Tax=Dreissena polymorpha TaxID=45954 RepID=A0A9D4I2S9_DREPO|nr:hypothetical protein DPMN_048332 [Dreissena polymorpha]